MSRSTPRRRIPDIDGVPVPYGEPPSELESRLRRSIPEARAAFWALSFDASPEALGVLVRALEAPDWSVRRLAAEAVGAHARGYDACAALRPLLNDESSFVVRTACQVLGECGDTESHDRIRALLASPDPATRAAAVSSLARVWRKTDTEPVLRLMKHDASPDVRKNAAWILHDHATASSWRALYLAWRQDPLPRHRAWACELARAFGGADAAADLTLLAADPDGHVRAAARTAIACLRGRR